VSRLSQASLVVAVAITALAVGFLIHSATRQSTPVPLPAASARTLLEASLPDPAGQVQRLAQWQGKVVVFNFWATWCAPCREEIPALIQVQKQLAPKGVQVVGIAIDQPDKVRTYAAEMGINYPIVVGELEAMDLARAAGNEVGGLPFTLVVDRAGNAAGTVTGRVTADKLFSLLQPLL